jgi:hypothetical protein
MFYLVVACFFVINGLLFLDYSILGAAGYVLDDTSARRISWAMNGRKC